MSLELYNHLKKFVDVDERRFSEIIQYFEPKILEKKEIILSAHSTCRANYFVASGCLHMYFVNDKGAINTIQFGIENWWITDNLAFLNQGTIFRP